MAIAATALLFVVFGALRRGREKEQCGDCAGGCAGCGGEVDVCESSPSDRPDLVSTSERS